MIFLINGVNYMIFSFLDSEDYFRMMTFVSKKFSLDFKIYAKYGGIIPNVLDCKYIRSSYCRHGIVKYMHNNNIVSIEDFMYIAYKCNEIKKVKYFYKRGYFIKSDIVNNIYDKKRD